MRKSHREEYKQQLQQVTLLLTSDSVRLKFGGKKKLPSCLWPVWHVESATEPLAIAGGQFFEVYPVCKR